MKNTVKLEQFKEVTEAELQEIRGGDKRLPYFCYWRQSWSVS